MTSSTFRLRLNTGLDRHRGRQLP